MKYRLVITFLAAFALCLAQGRSVEAATINVTTTDDELNGDGDCSMREAIEAANTNAASDACAAGGAADTINLPAGTYSLTIPGGFEDANATGDLDIMSDLTINGAGAATTIIEACDSSSGQCIGIDQVLHIQGGASVGIAGVTIQNGSHGGINNGGTLALTESTISGNGTSADFGGGIANAGTLTVTNSTVSGNSAIHGGGIYNSDTLNLTDTTVSGNTATTDAGGGIYNFAGTLTVSNSTFSGNSAPAGGGIASSSSGLQSNDGTLIITNSTFYQNSAGEWGGGIFDTGGTLSVTNTTISANTANHGGGVYIYPWNGTSTVTNSTFSSNSAIFNGGGLVNSGQGSPSTTTVTSSTFSGNSATTGGGILNDTINSTLTVRGTIVANSPSGGNCSGTISDDGGNLQHPGMDCGATIPSADPMLSPLAGNGGPTETHALLLGSPAIGGASPPCPPPPTDQRGVSRPQGASCDIGAFEFMAGWPTYGLDPRHTGRSDANGPNTADLEWSRALGVITNTNNSPVVGPDGAVYVTTWTRFFAINPDGTELCSRDLFASAATPAVAHDGSAVYVPDGLGIHAIHPATCQVLWDFPTRITYSSPAVGVDGTIYVGSAVGSAISHLYALNPDGTLKWDWNSASNCWIESSPAIGTNGEVYFLHNCLGLVALDANGQFKWTQLGGSCCWNSPSVGPDGTIYIGTSSHLFAAVNPDGTIKWQAPVDNTMYVSSSAISGDGSTIYRGDNGGIFYAFDSSGSVQWRYDTGSSGTIDSAPALSGNGVVYFTEGSLYALRASDGALLWQYATGSSSSSPAITADGTLYTVSGSGVLYAFGCADGICNDADADGALDSVDPCLTNPDCDADGFKDGTELYVGTDPLADCGFDAWPPDINNDSFVDVIGDITPVANYFGQSVPPAPARYNIAPDPPDSFIDVIGDLSRMAGLFGQNCGP